MNVSEIIKVVESNGFLERVFIKEFDWDAALDARDGSGFDEAWTSSYAKVEADGAEESDLIRAFRETVFKRIFHLTGNSEVAGYASDDLGLIARAAENGLRIQFIEDLWGAYTRGEFPCA